MVLKHSDPKNGNCYFTSEEFVVKKLNLKGKREERKEDTSCCIEDINSFENKRNPDEYNFNMRIIQDLTGWDYCKINFVFNGNHYDDLGLVVAVLAKRKNINEHEVFVFEDFTWLMTDDGKTIDRLI